MIEILSLLLILACPLGMALMGAPVLLGRLRRSRAPGQRTLEGSDA